MRLTSLISFRTIPLPRLKILPVTLEQNVSAQRAVWPITLALFLLISAPLSPVPAAAATTSAPVQQNLAADAQATPPAEIQEWVRIGEQQYPVPSPWRGNKVTAPDFSWEDFAKIPAQFTHNGGDIYLRAEVVEPLTRMLEAAQADAVTIIVMSGYRSAWYQRKIFLRMFSAGRHYEDIIRYVAPPGYSDHMLGTAVDFYPSHWRFAQTPQYTWLKQHAHRFSFEETYAEFNTRKMPWEAWHWNYIGPAISSPR